MNPPCIIRPMRAGDLDGIMALAADLKQAPDWPRQAYLMALNPQAALRRIALVALDRETGRLAGFAIANIVAPQAELEIVAVATGAQKKGIGRGLLAALIEEARTAAAGEFLLEVRASNAPALGLYRSLGWREAGRRPRYYSAPDEDAVLMSMKLG